MKREKPITRRSFMKTTLGSSICAAVSSFPAPSVLAAAKPRVVVIGGGAAGASAARFLSLMGSDISVTLVHDGPTYTTPFFSSLYLADLWTLSSLTHNYENLRTKDGINLVSDRAASIDSEKRTVSLSSGQKLVFDRLIVAPGIDIRFDSIAGYDEDAAKRMPHAWVKGEETQVLHEQLRAMQDGGVVAICPPPDPARCPPAPYERASLIARYLHQEKPRSKILIIDSKEKFTAQALFEEAWIRFYPDMIEWLPADFTGGVKAVSSKEMSIMTDDESFEVSVANVIPAQEAGKIAQLSGLADESGWCPVAADTFESQLIPGIHVIGDAIIPDDMSKSAFAANSQARVCAEAVLADLTNGKQTEARFENTCWSFLKQDHAIKITASYEAVSGRITKTEGTTSQLEESDALRANTAADAEAWYDSITTVMFG